MSIVARRHDVNTNQLFKWRRELLPKAAVPAAVEAGTMVPVEIVAERPRRRRADRKGIIEIAFVSARVSLRGGVVPAVLRFAKLNRTLGSGLN